MATVWLRRLALVVAPASGESFASWVDRMALRNGCPPWAMVEALGLDVRASSDVRSLAYGVVTTPETCRAIEAATGVSSEVVRGMHLEVFDGSVLDLAGVRVGDRESVRRAEGREWVQFFGNRACLAASGGVWLAWWKLGWATVCPSIGLCWWISARDAAFPCDEVPPASLRVFLAHECRPRCGAARFSAGPYAISRSRRSARAR
ncbi:TniQ family protein [Nonomuraea sp. NPDC003707]